ncbi:hypothetical protein AB8B23_08145 [Leptotrichia sp. HSP-342]|uniref:DUF2262 domain-containing protein n=1 Tax=Leptotrichia mesophila TaxID=3239303 RepID=A0AB39V9B9_9FUSO
MKIAFNINDNGDIEDFEVDWLGKKVYVSMEEAEIYNKELEKQMSLILDNVEERDVKIKNSIVKKYLGMANSRLKENKLSVPLEKVIQKLGNSLTKYDNARNGIITENFFFQNLTIDEIMPYSISQFSVRAYDEVLFDGYMFITDAEIYEKVVFDDLTNVYKKS